jgi:hypothetical protein
MLRPILGGCALGLTVFCLAAGLGTACGSGALLECRAEAVSLLPLEPDLITLGDVKEVARRVKACQSRGDAGP